MLSRGNWMSITAPMHWTILPSVIWVVLMVVLSCECLDGGGAADDFRKFLGDGGLAGLVVERSETVDHGRGVVVRPPHRHHARRPPARDVLRDRLVDDLLQVARAELVGHD